MLTLTEGTIQYAPNQYGMGLKFDGMTGFEFTGLPDAFWSSPYSLMMWVNIRGNGPFVAHGRTAGTGPNFVVQNDAVSYFGTDFNDGLSSIPLPVLPIFTIVIYTFDGTVTTVYDSLRSTTSATLPPNGGGVGTFLGSLYGIETEHFLGEIDELRLFNVALTPAQAFQLIAFYYDV